MSSVRCKLCGSEFDFKAPNAVMYTLQAISGVETKATCPFCRSTNVEAVFEDTGNTDAAPAITINANASVDALLKRAALFLEDGEWDTANVYYDQILDAEPENSMAYLGILMAELHCHTQEELQNREEPFDSNANYKKALRFGSDDLKTALQGYIEAIKTRKEHKRLDAIYDSAVKKMREAVTEEDFQQAIGEFQRVPGWKDAEEIIADCQKSIAQLRIQNEQTAKRSRIIALIAIPIIIAIVVAAIFVNKVNTYDNAVALLDAGQYSEAAESFSKLGSYKGSEEKLNEALEAVKLMEMEASYQAALELLTETTAEAYGSAYQMLQELGDYKDAKEMLSDFQLLESSWEWNYHDGEISSQKTYAYSRSGYQMTVFFNGEPISNHYEFNEQGQLLTCKGKNNYLLEYRYHPNGEIAYSYYPYVSDGETDKYIGFFETEYDTNGMPISRRYKYKDKYENQWNWDYHYAEDGTILSVDIRYLRDDDEGFLTVDLEGQGLEMVVDTAGVDFPQYRAVSEDGKQETIYNVAWKNKALVFYELTETEYDDHHNVISETNYTSGATYTYQHTYDENGQLLATTNVSAGSTTEYTYDDYGNCIKRVIKDADGDITERTWYSYDYFYTPDAQ